MNQLTLTRRAILAPLLITFLVLSSCKKDPTDVPRGPGGAHTNLGPKVNEWLEEQASKVSGDRPQKIENLKQEIDWATMHEEDLYDNETMIVASIKPAFQTVNNKGKNPKNYLLLIVNKEGNIRNGYIVQFMPAAINSFKELPDGFFNKYYNQDQQNLTGTLTYLSVSDDLLYETKYENGRIKAASVVEKKAKPSGSGRTNIECYDVWWVTYYPDGSSTWEYLYSFCNGGEQPCKGAIAVNGRTYLIGCGGGGGGEGGGDEQNLAKAEQWTVNQSLQNYFIVKSYENLFGKRIGNNPAIFTNITHSNSAIFNVPNSQYTCTWQELSNLVQLTTASTARSDVSGKVELKLINYPNDPPQDHTVDGHWIWTSFAVFP